MAIWSAEIKELEKLYEYLKGHSPVLEKELEQLIRTDDANVILLYSRRCLEVIITDLCECELERPRKTEPLKGIIDKLHKEDKVPSHIISSMHGLNELSTYGAHPKDFDPELVKPVLNNLDIIIKWYTKYKGVQVLSNPKNVEEKFENKLTTLATKEKSIIVLPFENISPDPDQEYFSDGLTEEIITDLSHIHDLLVISRSSAMTYKGTKKKIRDIVQDVNVQYVLEGSVRKVGNNLRITAQLINGLSDTHLWAEKYTGTLDDVFDIQEKVSRSIVKSLMIHLSPAENRQISEKPIENVQAYEFYLKGIKEMHIINEISFERALSNFLAGLKIVGDNALIYAGIGTVYCNFFEFGIKATEEVLKKAEDYAFKVLELAPSSSLSYSLLGRIERFRGNALRAIKYFRQALKIDPYDPEAQFWLVVDYCGKAGRPNLAKPILQGLMDRDPMSPTNYLASGIYYWMTLDMDRSLQAFNNLASLDPESVLPNFWCVYILIWNKEYEKAFELIDQIPPLESSDTVHKIFNGWLLFLKFALKGEKEKALEFLTEEVLDFFWNDPDFPWLGAGGYALIGEKDEALRWLEHCLNKGSINYPLFSKLDPFFENIHGEERFKKLMERIKYEWENFEV